MMKLILPLSAVALGAIASGSVMAQSTSPGASGSAPGQQPGAAKKAAPGQKMLKEPGKPGGQGGASKYAPGQQPKTPQPKTK